MKAFITAEFSPDALDRLRDVINGDIVYESWRSTKNLYFNDEDLIAKITKINPDIFICEGDNVKKDVIERTCLKIIGSTRDDPNNVDVETATKKGIPVIFTPKRNTISVAELTVGLILALARKVHSIERTVHAPSYKVEEFSDYVSYINLFKGIELHGKTVGIIGLGSIGFEVAKRLVPFQVKFLVHDPYAPAERLQAINAKAVSLNELMERADIVTVHCPPTDATDGLVGAGQIKRMKPTAYFVNLARASVTDEEALYDALKNHRIAGAALDVFSVEPLDHENEFLKLDNVIVTPHVGGNTADTNHRHGMMIVDAIEKILKGTIPANLINPEVMGGSKTELKSATGTQLFLLRQQIIDTCRGMVEKGYVVSTAGNVSARVRDASGNDTFLITPSTVEYETMRPEDLVLIDAGGNVLEGNRNPSSERRLHLAIYKARSDIGAVVHSHAPFSTVLSIARVPIGPVVDEFIPFVGGCNVSEFAMAGTSEIAENVLSALGDNMAALVANHGNVCCGATIKQAWDVAQMVEHAANIQYHASLLGTMYGLPEDVEESEREIYDIMKNASNGND